MLLSCISFTLHAYLKHWRRIIKSRVTGKELILHWLSTKLNATTTRLQELKPLHTLTLNHTPDIMLWNTLLKLQWLNCIMLLYIKCRFSQLSGTEYTIWQKVLGKHLFLWLHSILKNNLFVIPALVIQEEYCFLNRVNYSEKYSQL